MGLLALLILYKDTVEARLLKEDYDLSAFGFYQRHGIKEFTLFTARTLAERSSLDTRSTVTEGDYTAHIYVRKDRLTGFALSTHDYPRRVAHSMLIRVLTDFEEVCPSSRWHDGKPNSIAYDRISIFLSEYQHPERADNIMRIQADLDETKIVLHNTMESLLERGETLDELVQRSSILGSESKMFYKVAKKTNRCCSI